MTTEPTQQASSLLPLIAAELDEDTIPDRILLSPWGVVETKNGSFQLDSEAAREVIEAFDAHGTDLPIDYEHQTLGGRYSSPSGQAPAAGWIRKIVAEPDQGLFAEVAWTQAAREQLAGGEYRYLSPVAMVRKTDRRIVSLHSAALTNKPAIPNMRPLVASEDIPDEALVILRDQLGLPEGAQHNQMLMAASERIAELEAKNISRIADERVAHAMQQGKLTPAQKEWAMQLALTDNELFDKWLSTAPVVVPLGRTQPPDTSHPGPSLKQIEASARMEYQSNPALHEITSEEAWIADAIQEHKRQIA